MKLKHFTPGTARCVVELTVTVETGAWGPECTIAQAVEQAREEAVRTISKIIDQSGKRNIRIYGTPQIARVIVDADGKS